MKNILGLFMLLASYLFAATLSSAKGTSEGFQVNGTQLLESTGDVFVMRGVNISHVWFPEQSQVSLKDASALGCNTVRLVLGNGGQWGPTSPAELKQLLNWCERYGLIAVVEVHDITGYGDKPLAAEPETAVQYWLDPQIQKVLNGLEDRVILNIANEPFGNKGSEHWFDFHIDAIRRLREAGYCHTIMVDAAHWGQDWKKLTLHKASQVLEADPLKNAMFAVHMYEHYKKESVVKSYLETAQENGLCMIVGEFGMDHHGKPVAAESIIKTCNDLDMGYLGWSWSGNGKGTESLDLVIDFDAEKLSPWGELLFNHPEYGIKATSKKSDIFGWD